MGTVRYASHHVVLEPQHWQIRVGGDIRTPEPRVFELLAYLMRNPGRVVPKSELLDSLWAGEVVGESVLTRCISCIRKLIADDARVPKFIRTAHGRGYEFIAPVTEQPGTTSIASTDELDRPVSSPLATSLREGGFVGRAAEAARLKELLRDVTPERAKFVLVTGEAGIGKTRLLEEATHAVTQGAEVHWARASSVEGAPPFFLWRQCLRSIIAERSQKTVLRAFRDSTTGARKLLLGTDHWQSDDRLGWDSPSERFRTFDAIARALAELSRQRALVLVLDDLHAADLASLLLLEFTIEQLCAPVLLLGAMRDSGPLPDPAKAQALSRIRGASQAEVTLSGLSRDEVDELVKQTHEQPAPALVDEIHERTGGNPFFLSVLAPSVGSEPLPAAVRQAVDQRLSALPNECAALLRLGAVYGRELDGSLLARAADLPLEQGLRLLKIACDAHLVKAASQGRFRFVHDLVRERLYEQLSGEERARAHLAVGRVLELLPEYQRAEQAAALAHHFALAAECGGASRALDLSLQAGAYALRNFAYEDAIQHFTRASRLLPTSGDADFATECAVLLDLGLSQISAGLREAGQSTLHLAAAKAREHGSAEELGTVALSLSPGLFAIETGVYDATLVEVLREALEQVGAGNDKLRALLLARLALALYWSDTFEERARLCAEAESLAKQIGTADVLAAVTTARAFALLRPSNLDERRRLSEEAVELCQRAGDHQSLLLNRLLLGAMYLEGGDVAAAGFETDAFRKLAEETRQPQSLWIVEAHRASRLLLDGRLGEVEQLAGGCLMAGQRTRDHNALLSFGVHLTLLRLEQGRGNEVLEVIRDYAARYPRIVGWRVLYAYALGRSGQAAAATAEYASLKGRQFALPDDLNWMVSMAWLAETCHAERDAEGAELLYERLSPFADRLVVVGYAGIACLGSVGRYLGLLSATVGRTGAARQHFERATLSNRRASAHLPLAYTLHDHAAALLASDDGADHVPAALACLNEAAAFAEERNLAALSRALGALRSKIPTVTPKS